MDFLLLGAGGFAKEAADLIEALNHRVVACFQDADSAPATGHTMRRIPTVNSLDDVSFDAIALAAGRAHDRATMFARFRGTAPMPTLVHPSACVSEYASLGEGVLVMQNAVVNADAQVDAGVLLNVAVCVAHDCHVGEFSHLAPGTQMGGGSSIGARCDIGTGTVVLPSKTVGEGSTSGAGSVITKDVGPNVTVVGVPARER